MPPVQIRPIEASDLEALTTLFVRCFNAPPWNDGWPSGAARERLEAVVSAADGRGVLARLDSRVVGMALGRKERWVEGYHFLLQEMCVEPGLQRQGIGQRLLDHLRRQLAGEAVKKIYLLTSPGDAAEAFYARQGFRTSRGRIVMVSDEVPVGGS